MRTRFDAKNYIAELPKAQRFESTAVPCGNGDEARSASIPAVPQNQKGGCVATPSGNLRALAKDPPESFAGYRE